MRHVSIVAIVLVGCGSVNALPDANGDGGGDGPTDVDGVKSGSRLQVEWLDFSGTLVWRGIYDAVRRESCYPSEWSSGQRFCTPGDTMSVAYADAGCTQKYGQAYVEPGCTRPTPIYVIEYGSTGCTSRPQRLYQRGARAAVTQYYYKSSDGMCYGPNTGSSYEFYALGAEVPIAELAPMTLSEPVGGGRLAQRFFESTDGLRIPSSYAHDTMLNAECYLSYQLGSTSAECRPSSTGYASYYGDATCTTVKHAHYNPGATGCPAPRFVQHQADQCVVTQQRFYDLGAELAGSPLFYKNASTCTSTTAPSPYRFFGVGAELTLAAAARTPDQTGRRISTIHHNTSDVSIRDYTLHDNMLSTDCTPYQLTDGSVRCLPVGTTSVQQMFTDAACTSPIDIVDVYRGPAGCPPPPLSAYAMKYLPCGSNYEIYDVGAPHTGALYTNYGSCQPYTPTHSIPYRAGALVPIDQFASGTKLVE